MMMFSPFPAPHKLNVGDRFKIKHVDGYVANEVVDRVVYVPEGDYFHYVCASAACYSSRDEKFMMDIENKKDL